MLPVPNVMKVHSDIRAVGAGVAEEVLVQGVHVVHQHHLNTGTHFFS